MRPAFWVARGAGGAGNPEARSGKGSKGSKGRNASALAGAPETFLMKGAVFAKPGGTVAGPGNKHPEIVISEWDEENSGEVVRQA